MKMKNKKVVMDPWEGPFTEDVLPGARFFARNHTEDDYEPDESVGDREQLLMDGEWDMPDFGAFYARYSDVYYFLASTSDYEDEDVPPALKTSIEDAYRNKAFRGGFSYVHFYDALVYNRGRYRRLGVDEIQYASPGFMNINREKEVFVEARKLITDYLKNRKAAKELYEKLYRYLAAARLLPMSGDEYRGIQPTEPFILKYAAELS